MYELLDLLYSFALIVATIVIIFLLMRENKANARQEHPQKTVVGEVSVKDIDGVEVLRMGNDNGRIIVHPSSRVVLTHSSIAVSYTHLTLPTIYSV